jgi:hypothetical protein
MNRHIKGGITAIPLAACSLAGVETAAVSHMTINLPPPARSAMNYVPAPTALLAMSFGGQPSAPGTSFD